MSRSKANRPMSDWMRIARTGLLVLPALMLGCASHNQSERGSDVRSVYAEGRRPTLHVLDARSPIAAQKVVPVVTAPEVFALYVPGHVDRDRDMYVGEHWLFVKLRESTWNFSRKDQKPVPPGGPADMNKIRRSLPRLEGIDRILVPHEKKKAKREYINGK